MIFGGISCHNESKWEHLAFDWPVCLNEFWGGAGGELVVPSPLPCASFPEPEPRTLWSTTLKFISFTREISERWPIDIFVSEARTRQPSWLLFSHLSLCDHRDGT